jgi:DNA (cytosine-5)-methyltransferase 1
MLHETINPLQARSGAEPGFRFIDLFAGIGGLRLAAEASLGECVFSSEIDKAAALTYERNFGEKPHGDITAIDPVSIPDHDLLLGGFPCQPFSISGFKRGFQDTRGTLFFHILEIAKTKRPKCLILENVKHFRNHDGGRTLRVITDALTEIGYRVSVEVLNARRFGLAQSRERTIIVASELGVFDFSRLPTRERSIISDILEPTGDFFQLPASEFTLLAGDAVKSQAGSGLRFVGYRNRELRKVGTRPGTEHLSRVHKQPNRIYGSEGTHPTLSAGESSGRYWILHEGRVRKLTMRECYRLQGFPETYAFHPSASASYKQIGNSVPVPMIAEVIRSAIDQSLVTSPAATLLAA